jgi:hypothetical protein
MKHLYYPLYLAILASLLLFRWVAHRLRLSPRWIAAGYLLWGVGTSVFMVLSCEPWDWFRDFHLGYWSAGRMAFTAPADMYGAFELTFVNLPLVAVAFVPFVSLGPYTAGTIFGVISLGVAVLAWWQLVSLGSLGVRQRWLLAGLFVLSGPLFYSLREGNLTTWVLPLLVAALAALLANRAWRCGALLGVAVIIKPPLLLLPAYYAFRRRWSVAGGSALVILAAVACSVVVFGIDVHRIWYERCLAPFSAGPVGAYNSQSISSFLGRFWAAADCGEYWRPIPVGPGFHLLNKAVLLLVAGSVVLVCLRRRGEDPRIAERLDYCLVLSLALLLSPLCWTHYFLLLLLPAALLLGGQLGPWPAGGKWALPLAFLAQSIPVRAWALGHWWLSLIASHYFAGALVVLASLLAMRWRQSKAQQHLCPPGPRPTAVEWPDKLGEAA